MSKYLKVEKPFTLRIGGFKYYFIEGDIIFVAIYDYDHYYYCDLSLGYEGDWKWVPKSNFINCRELTEDELIIKDILE